MKSDNPHSEPMVTLLSGRKVPARLIKPTWSSLGYLLSLEEEGQGLLHQLHRICVNAKVDNTHPEVALEFVKLDLLGKSASSWNKNIRALSSPTPEISEIILNAIIEDPYHPECITLQYPYPESPENLAALNAIAKNFKLMEMPAERDTEWSR